MISRAMVTVGTNESLVDENGNTLFHKAATSLCRGTRGLEDISKLGVDINQANHALRTPLHVLCSIGWFETDNLRSDSRWMIKQSKDVNAVDSDGITPLHLACTVSELLVKELLAGGADASAKTSEGLTPLHIATRARRSNAVGMLVAALEQQNDKEKLSEYVNAKDELGRSPLHYACRSGRPETVTLLLAAGADPGAMDIKGMTMLDACAEFEEEQILWEDYRTPTGAQLDHFVLINKDTTYECAAGTKIHDTLRPFVAQGVILNELLGRIPDSYVRSDQDTTRLEEVLELLLHTMKDRGQNTDWMSIAIGRSIQQCESNHYAYTAQCLKQLPRLVAGSKESVLQPYGDDPRSIVSRNSPTSERSLERLIRERKYNVIECLSHQGAIKSPEMNFLLRILADHGFAQLLSKLLVGPFANQEIGNELSIRACRRGLPNVEVLRTIVQLCGISIDGLNQALSTLAESKSWWQLEQGIPYLLSIGGSPPLRSALLSNGNFANETALAMVNLRTDINCISNDGSPSVLELAVFMSDVELVRRILSTGTTISSAAVFRAIDRSAVDVLRFLLHSGANPNCRPDNVENQEVHEDWSDVTYSPSAPDFHIRRGKNGRYALYRAACPDSVRSGEHRLKCGEMMTALLDAGADAFAIYRQPLRRPWKEDMIFPGVFLFGQHEEEQSLNEENDDDEWSEFDGGDYCPVRTKKYGLQNVLHGLLENGLYVKPILSHPNLHLDVEYRNPLGRTLLQSACRSALGADASIDEHLFDSFSYTSTVAYLHHPSEPPDLSTTVVGILLSRGADALATDIYGKNMLHHLLEAHDPIHSNFSRAPPMQNCLRHLAKQFPQLCNKPDNLGTYPLHSAFQRMRRYTQRCNRISHTEETIETLLAAGADPHVRDARGNTALHYLADGLAEQLGSDGQRRLFQVFLDREVDVNLSNNAGLTPLAIMLYEDEERSESRECHHGPVVGDDDKRTEEIDTEVFGMFDKAHARWNVKDQAGRDLFHVLMQHRTKNMAWRWRFLVGKGLQPPESDDS